EYGNRHTVYMRFSRWAKRGVLTEVFQRLQQEQLIDPDVLGLDSTTVKVHPDGCGALRKRGPQAIGRSRGGLTTKIHMIAADARTAIIYAISPGQDHDGPHGRELLKSLGPANKKPRGKQLQLFLVADRAYEGDETRRLAVELGYTPVIPPKSNRRDPWDFNRDIYKRRNEIERLFRRLKGYRRVFVRYDKLDVIFLAFITLALIHDTTKT
ncbi:MAG: IS5 family transposase, partial [Acidimicrobiia bacterium]|nr:IS5 family transposase [Acidimicrobiia bacterium]